MDESDAFHEWYANDAPNEGDVNNFEMAEAAWNAAIAKVTPRLEKLEALHEAVKYFFDSGEERSEINSIYEALAALEDQS